METISYQGIADRIARAYLIQHGSVRKADVAQAMAAKPSCPKLFSYWHFHGCGYRKGLGTCNEPSHYQACSLPKADLRNGHLNQAAYSLYLFLRDVSGGDFVDWIDRKLEEADGSDSGNRGRALCSALLKPLGYIYGASAKVWSMSLSGLLLGADPARERWVAAGTSMIAVDTLVHNWFCRTGILNRLQAEHPYGPACYNDTGCRSIIDRLAARLDASAYNPEFPKSFPRFVQSAIWAFCAQQRLDLCNGNRIDDRACCQQADCPLYVTCDRLILHQPRPDA
jgi:hypothetical protein